MSLARATYRSEPSPLALRLTRRHPVVTFYLIAFAISWAGYLPQVVQAFQAPHPHSDRWLASLLLPAIGPGIAVWITRKLAQPEPGQPLSLWAAWTQPVPALWWLFAAFLPAALLIVSNSVSSLLSPASPQQQAGISGTSLLLFALISLGANPWEELGWRAFALRRLESRWNPLSAALLVGVLWALWHLPLFLIASGPVSMIAIPFWTWAAGCVARSVLLAWLYNSTRQSLGIVTVAHLSSNFFGALLGVRSFLVFSAAEVATAVLILFLCGSRLGLENFPPATIASAPHEARMDQ